MYCRTDEDIKQWNSLPNKYQNRIKTFMATNGKDLLSDEITNTVDWMKINNIKSRIMPSRYFDELGYECVVYDADGKEVNPFDDNAADKLIKMWHDGEIL